MVLYSCNPTKYVPANETLLNKNHVNVNKEDIKKSAIIPYIKQQPNKRIFGARFHLGLYNLSNINKTKWPHGWLRQIGEEPVIFDPAAADKSAEQIKSYISSKGYFDSRVQDSIKTADRKTDVYYNVKLRSPYTVRNLYFDITDTIIRNYFYFDSVNCLIQRGKPYDVDVLIAERAREERFIRDKGFYAFSSEFISFNVDSTIGKRQVDIYYNIRNSVTVDNSNKVKVLPQYVYQVKNVYIYPDYDPGTALEEGEAYIKQLDTIPYKGYYFITSKEKPEINYDLILQTLYLRPGTDYNLTNTDQTQSHLMGLKVYRLVNISYDEVDQPADPMELRRNLNANIMLTLLTPQSYRIELEGTHTNGNLGGGVNLVYQHKNLFHGAELLNVSLRGSYEAFKLTAGADSINRLASIQEYGAEVSLKLPQFLIPFVKKEGFIKKYNPSTSITAAYSYQAMPIFTRSLATATFGYTWKAGNYNTHIVNPLQLNLVNLQRIDPIFAEEIKKSFQAYNYMDVLIIGGGYSLIFNNQTIQKSKDFTFMRMNFETSGNMLSLVDKLSGIRKQGDSTYMFLGQPYAQYVRTDIDLRYNYRFNDLSSIVYRGFIGVGIPYGNSRAIPFEKQYFAGGSNSIRAWQVRSLGPGSYNPGKSAGFLNQTGDIKIELNAEYRYKLFWILEGALFVDAGNIWTYNKDVAREGTQFRFDKFLNDMAVGTGTGLRFDFKFVIGRVDFGMKLRDPRALGPDQKSNWIFLDRPYNLRDFSVVLGIGYPF
jgi:outer membrane translocation and assembly module TamA